MAGNGGASSTGPMDDICRGDETDLGAGQDGGQLPGVDTHLGESRPGTQEGRRPAAAGTSSGAVALLGERPGTQGSPFGEGLEMDEAFPRRLFTAPEGATRSGRS